MAAVSRVVDISEDAVAVRRRRRRALLRIGVPILGITLVIAAIIGIALFSHNANRRGVLALSDDLLNTLDAQIAQRVSAFLDPCERALRIMRDMARDMPLTERRASSERFAISVLRELPQIAAFYVGDSAGDFLMVRRHEGGVETKQIMNDASGRSVIFVDRNAQDEEIARREDPSDTYDPRTRPWFQGAIKTGDVFWTGIYVFFSDKKPGITVSSRVQSSSGPDRVFGVDVTLEELSKFLSSLEIGTHGRALIMDEEGRIIAVPHSEQLIKPTGEEFVPPKIDELHDPVLTKAFDIFRVEGKGRRVIEVDGVHYISSVTPTPGDARNWWILITVPEDDFIGFVANNNKTALLMSSVIVLAVVVLAALLVRQGLRADRSVRTMSERGRIISQQSATYTAISDQMAQGTSEAPPALTEGVVAVTSARRASTWRLTGHGQTLHCPDSFDRDSQGHAAGFQLHRRELSTFFDLLEAGEETTIADAAADRRTAQFHAIMMRPLGSRALTLIPLRQGERVIGAICIEDAGPLDGAAMEFLRTVAAMLSAKLEAPKEDRRPVATGTSAVQPLATATATPILAADLGPSPAERAEMRADYYPEVAVAVLSLTGSQGLAQKVGTGGSGVAVQISEYLQDLAAEHGITYVKLVGQEATAAIGFEERDGQAMTRIAGLAIATRDRLSHLCDVAGHGLEFRIGLSFGACYGCLVGRERHQFNLWGEAFETAGIMSRTAAPGAIQASASAYAQLRQDFLFRPRGTFYLPGLGQSSTFVLAGQL